MTLLATAPPAAAQLANSAWPMLQLVLAQLALPSPQLNTFFRLSASAVGTTITLDLNGVPKLSVDDLTFSTGSIGILLDPGTSTTAKHRVDTLTANVQ